MKVLITGGAGFIGSHAAEFFAGNGHDVIVFDNLSRAELLGLPGRKFYYNWDYLKKLKKIKLLKKDIRNIREIEDASKGCDVIVHAAAQTAVTASCTNPKTDFEINAMGTLNVLEAARKNDVGCVIYCSTNKVYGDNINRIGTIKGELGYKYEKKYSMGVPETFPVDLCGHTPYGCSKLAGDFYTQDYGRLYGIKTGVFRLSCVYGARQFGVEDQGWVAWMAIASLLNRQITVYGDGKQARDVLYVDDLVGLMDKFIKSDIKGVVLNAGGGPENTLSILELIRFLEKLRNKKINVKFGKPRPNDQKVYISDVSKARSLLKWSPSVGPERGILKLDKWVSTAKDELIRYF